jgi:GT2 family glycosyltransferase
MKKIGIILVNYKDYAKRFLADCRDSLRAQDYQNFQIYIVDNQTGEESFEYLAKNYPEAKILRNENNDGFAKGNNDGIKKALADGCEYVFLLNMDTVCAPTALSKMVEVIELNEKIGSVQARLMIFSDKNKINSLGNATHFLGFGYCLGYNENWEKEKEDYRLPIEIFYPSGAAVLFRKEALEEVGFLDEEYWMYNEDQEIGWRLLLAGWKNVLAPDAVIYHKYEFSRSISKYYWMDRNRILAILECYQLATLLFILPAFILMEFGLILFSAKNGSFKEKMKIWRYFLTPKNWRYIFRARFRNQELRKIRDKEIAHLITGKIWYQEIGDWKLRLINPIFNAYWLLVRALLTFL